MNILNSFNSVKYLIAPFAKLLDLLYKKADDFWGFTVHYIKSDQFIENARA